MATQAGYTLGQPLPQGDIGAIGGKKKTTTAVAPTPNIAPPVIPVQPPTPPVSGGPNITPSVTPQETAVKGGTTITSYAGGGGPQILPPVPPPPPESAVPGGQIITSYAGGSGPQINPAVPSTDTAVPITPTPETLYGGGGPNIQPPVLGGLGALPQSGNPITTFGPGNDLISSQINPVASGRTGDTMSAVDAARNALSGGPNRSDLAAQYIDQWNQRTQPQFQQDLTNATKLAAANGRIGSGMLTNAYGDIVAQRDAARQVAQQGFATDALAGTIQDRLNNLGALSGLESQQYGQDAANRNEVRGERGYQQGLSQQAFTNDAQRLALEEALTQGSYGRESDRLNQLINLGYMNNPGSLYLGASGQVQSGANQSNQGMSDLLAQYFLGKNATG